MNDLETTGTEPDAVDTTPVETEAAEPLSLRDSLRSAFKEVAAKTDEPATTDRPTQTRAADGKFAPKEAAPVVTDKPAEVTKVTEATEQPAAQTFEVKPPVSWSSEAKADFAKLPVHVQQAIAKREHEVDNGFKVLQDYKGLDEFTPLIKQAGTTHAEVISKAISWENALKSDPLEALQYAARVYGVDLAQLAGSQAQQRQVPMQQQPAFDPRMIDQKVNEVLDRRTLQSEVEKFFSDSANKYAAQVKPIMAGLLQSGQANDLKDAYEKAIWANPEIRTELLKQQVADQEKARAEEAEKQRKAAAADQARRASRSISGSNGPGASKALQTQPATVRDALSDAFRSVRGQV